MKNVLLVNMPFVSIARPAIGVSILKARLAEEGIESEVAYANLIFAELAGVENYNLVDEKINLTLFAGDWLFAQCLFGEKLDLDTYLATLRHYLKNEEEFNTILDLRGIISPFLQECMDRLKIEKYGIVGFTTTFQQNFASLALAYTIKRVYPKKIIVFGGANCEGIMGVEIHRSFPWIDYVCCGESDYTFPELVKRIDSGSSVKDIHGIVYRDSDCTISTGPSHPVHDMDQIPHPDYDDYFSALANSPLGDQVSPTIPIENSRGCWWGARSQCTFCGLNGEAMEFRSKSASRVMRELGYLKERYRISAFTAVDNVMDMKYFKELLPRLKKGSFGISLFYEVRANLDKGQIKLLKEAGVDAVQPGIESLSTHVLKLMKKGVTALQNIAFLKWCRQYGVTPAWNLLYGFPGETAEDYEQITEMMDDLCHLSPPYATGAVRLDRFSPYFNNPEKYGITGIKPFFTYNLIYPLPSEQVFNLAYFFQYEYGHNTERYTKDLLEKIDIWKRSNGGELIKRYGDNPELLLIDTRPNRRQSQVALNGIQREIYDYCDTQKSSGKIMAFARSRYKVTSDLESWLQQFLGQMVDWGFMIREGSCYLNLAIDEEGVIVD